MKSVIISCVGTALAMDTGSGVRRGTVAVETVLASGHGLVVEEQIIEVVESKQDAQMAQIEALRKEHIDDFFEKSSVTVAHGTVEERPVAEPRGPIVMPIVFDGVYVGYPPRGIPEEYIESSMFGKKEIADIQAKLVAAEATRLGVEVDAIDHKEAAQLLHARDKHAHGPQVLAGIGSEPYYRFMGWDDNKKNMINALFDPRVMPKTAPYDWFRNEQDVTRLPYNNFMAYIFSKTAKFRHLWTMYSNMKTPAGYTFTEGAKTGIDNPGHPNIIPCGFMFTDEDAPDMWKEFTDEMMFQRHKWHPERNYYHSSDLAGEVPALRVDPTVNAALMQGMFIKTSRIRTGRSIKKFPLPPSITFQQRRDLEQVIVKALSTLGETTYAKGFEPTLEGLGMPNELNLRGTYYPEFMSRSMSAYSQEQHPNVPAEHFAQGMDLGTNHRLLASGNAFQHPDSTLLLSTGCARHWPDARGVWENGDSDLFVWVSEEDHMRIVSMERGGNFQKVWMRFITGLIEIEEAIKKTGYEYILNERYGYILSCPSNTGAGIRAGSHIRMLYLPQWADGKLNIADIGAGGFTQQDAKKLKIVEGGFKGFCEAHRLQGRGMGGVDDESGGAIVDLSNVDRIGYTEAQLVTFAIKGMAGFVRLEMRLHFYHAIEAFTAALQAGNAAAAYQNLVEYLVEDKDKDGTVVDAKGFDGETYSGRYYFNLLDNEGAYISEFATFDDDHVAGSSDIAQKVHAAVQAFENGENYSEVNAQLVQIKPVLLAQFKALKEAGLAASQADIEAFKEKNKLESDAKKARRSNL